MSAAPDHTPDAPDPATLSDYRARIDAVDDILAGLLEYRAELTVAVQQLKFGSGGRTERDHQREAEIVARMARRAPGLGPVRLQQIMGTVIEASLDLADERR